jgi:hypothetical protein
MFIPQKPKSILSNLKCRGAIPLYFLQFTEWHWDRINYSYSVLLTKNAISEEEQGRTEHTHQKVVDGGMSED